MATTDNDLGPEAVEAVRAAAERAAEWPSRDRLDALARSLDVLARHEAERREALAIVQAVATYGVGGLMPAEFVTRARALLEGAGQ